MPCCAIMLHDASLAGCWAGARRQLCLCPGCVAADDSIGTMCSDMSTCVDSPVLVHADIYMGLERL